MLRILKERMLFWFRGQRCAWDTLSTSTHLRISVKHDTIMAEFDETLRVHGEPFRVLMCILFVAHCLHEVCSCTWHDKHFANATSTLQVRVWNRRGLRESYDFAQGVNFFCSFDRSPEKWIVFCTTWLIVMPCVAQKKYLLLVPPRSSTCACTDSTQPYTHSNHARKTNYGWITRNMLCA